MGSSSSTPRREPSAYATSQTETPEFSVGDLLRSYEQSYIQYIQHAMDLLSGSHRFTTNFQHGETLVEVTAQVTFHQTAKIKVAQQLCLAGRFHDDINILLSFQKEMDGTTQLSIRDSIPEQVQTPKYFKPLGCQVRKSNFVVGWGLYGTHDLSVKLEPTDIKTFEILDATIKIKKE